jgi:hypothetical protein
VKLLPKTKSAGLAALSKVFGEVEFLQLLGGVVGFRAGVELAVGMAGGVRSRQFMVFRLFSFYNSSSFLYQIFNCLS